MPTEAGYSNIKKQGRAVHKTLHPLGSSRVGQHIVPKSLVERQAIPVATAAVQQNSTDTLIRITVTGHLALVGDIARFYSGSLLGAELEIVGVEDANNFIIRNIVGVPTAGDTIKVMYYVTPKADAEGNSNFSPGPTTYIYNNTTTTAEQDTSDAANNRSLPSLVMFYKDGVQRPVLEDTVTPANTDPLPVKLVGLTGDVNITAGDLNVAVDATNDSVAIGDFITGNKAVVGLNSDTTTYALKVKDNDAVTELQSIAANTLALSATTGDAGSPIANDGISVHGSDGTNNRKLLTDATGKLQIDVISVPLPTGSATLAEQQLQTPELIAIKNAVQLIDNAVNADGNPVNTAGLMVGGEDGAGDFQFARVNTNGELSVTFGAAGFSTETTLAALNNKVANDYGASSGAVRTAAQLGNATGAADFGVGVDSAQTLRVSGNLKRAGNELSYSSGNTDANTLRVMPATDNNLAKAADLGALADAAVTDPSASGSVIALLKGLLTASTKVGSFVEILDLTNVAQTFTAPAGAKWFKIYTPTTNATTIRFKVGGTATISSGMQLQPGRSEDFQCVGNISVIAEDAATNQHVNVIWGV